MENEKNVRLFKFEEDVKDIKRCEKCGDEDIIICQTTNIFIERKNGKIISETDEPLKGEITCRNCGHELD